MPWTAASGNTYKLCLLDTNALSEIVKRPSVEGRGFINRFPPDSYIPCFTPYNLFEIRRRPDVYRLFVNFFDVYSAFLTSMYQDILEAERLANGTPLASDKIVLRSFSLFGEHESHGFEYFVARLFEMPDILREEQEWRKKEESILDAWIDKTKNFTPRQTEPNGADADRYVKLAAVDTLASIVPDWVAEHDRRGTMWNAASFPSLLVMLYSQYYRIFDRNWQRASQEVTDIRIIACSPYVDAVVTENFQAEILSKIRNRVRGLKSVEIARLRDIRP